MGGRVPIDRPIISKHLHMSTKDEEEIADGEESDEEDTDADTEDETDEDEESDDTDSDDDEEDDEDDDDEEDADEDEDSDDEDDSDDDSKKPLSKKERQKLAKLQARDKHSKENRDGASRRTSGKGKLSKERIAEVKRLETIEKTQRQLVISERKRAFASKANLSADEVDVLYSIKGRLKRKDLKDPIVKGALEGYRQSKRGKSNLPSTNARPFRPDSKEIKNLQPAERKSRFLERRRGILEDKRGR